IHAAAWTSASHTNSNVMFAYGNYGQGKFVVCSDSSPFEDPTGDPNDSLNDGWTTDAHGNHSILTINACLWLNPPVCNPPAVFLNNAGPVNPNIGQTTPLAATGGGTSPVYPGQRNPANISDGAESPGRGTTSLTIPPPTTADSGLFDITVANGCGSF